MRIHADDADASNHCDSAMACLPGRCDVSTGTRVADSSSCGACLISRRAWCSDELRCTHDVDGACRSGEAHVGLWGNGSCPGLLGQEIQRYVLAPRVLAPPGEAAHHAHNQGCQLADVTSATAADIVGSFHRCGFALVNGAFAEVQGVGDALAAVEQPSDYTLGGTFGSGRVERVVPASGISILQRALLHGKSGGVLQSGLARILHPHYPWLEFASAFINHPGSDMQRSHRDVPPFGNAR